VRHVWILRVLWAHVAALFAWGMIVGHPFWHAGVDVAPIAVCGLVAQPRRRSRRMRAAAVAMGLLTASAVVLHLMNGAIEGHFHFFVMVSLMALYEERLPCLLSIAYVVVRHGLMGKLLPANVFDHPDAVEHPWRWAAIHGAFVSALAVVNIVAWRLNEDAPRRHRGRRGALPLGVRGRADRRRARRRRSRRPRAELARRRR
jgi:hypothetical protein